MTHRGLVANKKLSFKYHFEVVLKMLKPTVSAMGDVVKVKIFLLAIRAIRSWQMERGIKSRYFSENFSQGIRDSCPRKQMDDWMWGRFWLRLEIKNSWFCKRCQCYLLLELHYSVLLYSHFK